MDRPTTQEQVDKYLPKHPACEDELSAAKGILVGLAIVMLAATIIISVAIACRDTGTSWGQLASMLPR